jgi:hypothetical protein
MFSLAAREAIIYPSPPLLPDPQNTWMHFGRPKFSNSSVKAAWPALRINSAPGISPFPVAD